MSREFRSGNGPTSPEYDFFQLMFQAADIMYLMWQPFLKGVGRYHLEMANLGARQSRTVIEFAHSTPLNATPVALLERLGDNVVETGRNVAKAADQAVVSLPLALPVKVELPKKPERDVMRLEEWVGWMDDDALEGRRAA